MAILAFVLAFAGAFAAEAFSINHTKAVSRNYPLNRAKMKRRVFKAVGWGFALGTLGHLDFLGYTQFHLPYLWMFLGDRLGEASGTQWVMWRDYEKKLKALSDPAPKPRKRRKKWPATVPDVPSISPFESSDS